MSTANLTHHHPAHNHPELALAIAAGLGFATGFTAGSTWARARLRRLRALLARERHAARHDPLTGLPNRTVIDDLLHHTRPALVGLLDIDDLKTVNDRYGHAAGDQLLRVVADRLAAAMTGHGVATRLSGDEFVLLWRHTPHDPLTAATTALDQLTTPATIDGHTLTPSASLGLAAAGPHLTGPHLLAAADAAMYEAKPRANRIWLYEHDTPPTHADRPAERRRDHRPQPPRAGTRPAALPPPVQRTDQANRPADDRANNRDEPRTRRSRTRRAGRRP